MITGSPSSDFVQQVNKELHQVKYIPNKVVIHIDPLDPPTELAAYNGVVKEIMASMDKDKQAGKETPPSLRVCRDFACGLPITRLDQAQREIAGG